MSESAGEEIAGTVIQPSAAGARVRVPVWCWILAGLGVVLLWSYWPNLVAMAHLWSSDPQYSHGYLVPLFSLAILWLRAESRAALALRLSWWGVLLLALGTALRLAGAHFYLEWFDTVSLLLCLAGLAVLLGGWPALRWSWPAVAFLLFMIPLPFRLQTALANPLQHGATFASTFALQTLGFPAFSEGNVIVIDESRINIAEACSGLTMLMTFCALSTAVAIVITRPWLDKLVLMASAVPIALLVNVARIVATGMAYEWIGPKAGQAVFHDWAGWLMMPLALGLMWLELRVLARLFLLPPPARGLPSVETIGIAESKPKPSEPVTAMA